MIELQAPRRTAPLGSAAVIALLGGLLAATQAHANVFSIYNTGVDGAGALLSSSASDTNWSVAENVGLSQQAVVLNLNPVSGFAWSANTASSQWVSYVPTGRPSVGDFVYSTHFNLSGLDTSTVSLTGLFSADDGATFYLNGVQVLSRSYPAFNDFSSLQAFNLSSANVAGAGAAYLQGVNTLTIDVSNAFGGGTGLQVEFTSNSADPIPKPASLALFGCALPMLAGLRRRFGRSRTA